MNWHAHAPRLTRDGLLHICNGRQVRQVTTNLCSTNRLKLHVGEGSVIGQQAHRLMRRPSVLCVRVKIARQEILEDGEMAIPVKTAHR
jgi:hypothetical protein